MKQKKCFIFNYLHKIACFAVVTMILSGRNQDTNPPRYR